MFLGFLQFFIHQKLDGDVIEVDLDFEDCGNESQYLQH
jgi:hypothetical protein